MIPGLSTCEFCLSDCVLRDNARKPLGQQFHEISIASLIGISLVGEGSVVVFSITPPTVTNV